MLRERQKTVRKATLRTAVRCSEGGNPGIPSLPRKRAENPLSVENYAVHRQAAPENRSRMNRGAIGKTLSTTAAGECPTQPNGLIITSEVIFVNQFVIIRQIRQMAFIVPVHWAHWAHCDVGMMDQRAAADDRTNLGKQRDSGRSQDGRRRADYGIAGQLPDSDQGSRVKKEPKRPPLSGC